MLQRFAPIVAAAAFAVLSSACATPKDLDLSLQHASSQGKFVVAMLPPPAGPAINQMHAWQVKLATPQGDPGVRSRRES